LDDEILTLREQENNRKLSGGSNPSPPALSALPGTTTTILVLTSKATVETTSTASEDGTKKTPFSGGFSYLSSGMWCPLSVNHVSRTCAFAKGHQCGESNSFATLWISKWTKCSLSKKHSAAARCSPCPSPSPSKPTH
jgi:hypothetical protein